MKLRRVAVPIALLVVAVGVGAYAVIDRGSVTDIERDARLGSVFPAFRRADITRIELDRGGETFVLVKDPSPDANEMDWLIDSPVKEVAEVGAVQSLLSAIELATRVRAVPGDAGAGLDDPRVVGVLSMGAITYRFEVGGPAPTPSGAAYLRLDGEGVFVVTRDLVEALLVPTDRFRPKNIVPYLSLDLAALTIDGSATKGLAIERVDSTDFRLPAIGLRASRAKLDAVWSAFGEMRAEAFLKDDAAAAAPVLHVTMTPEDRSKPAGDIVVGGPCAEHPEDVVVVRRAPLPALAACAPKGILSGLETASADVVDARLFSTHEDEVVELKLQLSPAGAVLELARDTAGWRERAPEDRELDPEEVDAANTLVQQIAHSEGTNVRKKKDEVIVPRVRAAIVRMDNRGVELVEIGQPDETGAITAHRLQDDALLTISRDTARLLEPRASAVRGRTVWRPPLAERPVTAVSTTCASTPEVLAREDGRWSMTSPPGYVVDSAAALDLADAVGRVTTEMWIADADDGSFGLAGKGACHVSLGVDDGGAARTVGLTLGGPARQGEALLYAKADSAPEVFVVPRSLRETASRLLVDRSAFRADPALVARVTLARPGGHAASLVPGPHDGDFVPPDGGPTDATERAASVLSGLVADDVVHLGAASPDEGFDHPLLEVRVEPRADAGAPMRYVVGLLTERANQKMYFARMDGVAATFAIAKDKVDELLRVVE